MAHPVLPPPEKVLLFRILVNRTTFSSFCFMQKICRLEFPPMIVDPDLRRGKSFCDWEFFLNDKGVPKKSLVLPPSELTPCTPLYFIQVPLQRGFPSS